MGIVVLRAEDMTEFMDKGFRAVTQKRISGNCFPLDDYIIGRFYMRPPCRAPVGSRTRKIKSHKVKDTVAVAVIFVKINFIFQRCERFRDQA